MKHILWSIATLFLMAGCVGPDRSDTLVVIDAGHGGEDCGALCGGKQEKDLVLQITKKLQKEFKRKGYRVYLTRGNDRFLKLGQRTRIADRKDAKVFISIHAMAFSTACRTLSSVNYII